ncbi:uncharacterized protein LOC113331283 [Papaver somniferum]|uniref:uncharacterized protein LOC113331283 n=1 Tax=Papaver somniferum TaxID=3469 RepID=UPI000E6F7A0C|nr:uncharacterized protein LOC113331283 [Papaver somniferum]
MVIAHRKLLVRAVLFNRGIIDTSLCPLCQHHPETLEHLFIYCPKVQELWNMVKLKWGDILQYYVVNLDWLCLNNSTAAYSQNLKWSEFFPNLQQIWIQRNKAIFDNIRCNWSYVYSKAVYNVSMFNDVCADKSSPTHKAICINISWEPPPLGYMKFNTDGASNDVGFAGAGGIIRDKGDKFKGAYVIYLYRNSNNMAKLLAIRDGLKLARSLNILNLVVENDFMYIIDVCNRLVDISRFFETVVQDIHLLARTFHSVLFCHQYREANNVADYLSKKAATKKCRQI